MEQTAKLLTGWKAIEDFVGLKREAILKNNFPIRKTGKHVIAVPEELLRHAERLPTINAENRNKTVRKTL